ncbi:MAG: carbohydrate binding family 9 domain-containing protein [Bacteroidales bacterium]|nr:carbohydrate binding family 9 domain-containing protein [Bacteroidales bacterium]MCF8390055.1 carbohydrate binding family 9 domain-containing protein [Bacteroidales bacterium]
MRNFLFAGFMFLFSISTFGQTLPKRIYKTERTVTVPIINGELDDEAWMQGEWEGNFIQFEPYNGVAPSQPTEFKVRFDDLHLYIAIKAYDSAPDSITNRMSRRDNGDGDMVYIIFDSYHDLRTGFAFGVSSAGARFDMIFSNDGQNEDPSWDPIWQAKAKIFDWGWAAEMKIPFTQLRFQKNSSDVWGFEVARQIYRHNEMSLWQIFSQNAPGMIHNIGELDGLKEIEPRKQLDIMPYTVGSYNTYESEDGNPFSTGKDFKGFGGLDGKLGVTNNLTMDFTVLPDFGQVEADPSEVNLTAFETYFREKRPFFIEGKNITSFNVGMGDGDVGNDNLFYSRRIGRRPHYDPDLEDNQFAKVPTYTNIIAATKLTGKTENGLSIGILESVTAEEKAEIDTDGQRSFETVEPLTNYSIVRLQKDINEGNTMIGGMATSTIRKLDGTNLDFLHKDASTAGIDFTQFFKEKNYTFSSSVFYSNVRGSAEAISETQQSSVHYFQRPDLNYVDFDTSRTQLSGLGGKIEAGKIGGNWNWLYLNTWKSPSVDINDVGFIQQADQILNVLWTGYNFNEPFGIFRSMHINTDVFLATDFGANLNGVGYEANFRANFKNMWSVGFGGSGQTRQVSKTLLRGGPSIKLQNSIGFFTHFSSDERKAFSLSGFTRQSSTEEKSSRREFYNLDFTVRPSNTLTINIEPEISKNFTELQYVDTYEFDPDTRYIFASLDQKVLSISLRVDYIITPDLTIQYWGQPFVAAGRYKDFKMITNPKADDYKDRFYEFSEGTEIIPGEDIYTVNDGIYSYEIENPNFSYDEFLSNLVVRWEFRPGSTAYIVWSQSRDYSESTGVFDVWDNMDNLFTANKPNNTFLIKFSYRFGLR